MLVRSKAPLRIGFAGGGTDLSPYCDIYGGCVLNATVNLYVYCVIRSIDENSIIFTAPDIDLTEKVTLQEKIPINGKLNLHKAVFNKINNIFDIKLQPFEIVTFSDVPPGSGLGSSSTLVVAMLKAYSEWLKLPLGEYDIASLAYEIERKDLGLTGGKQDQYAATFGGFNFMEFYDGDRVVINPLPVKQWIKDELQASCILFNCGITRKSSEFSDQLIEAQKITTKDGNNGSTNKSLNAMHEIKKTAFKMKEAVLMGNMENFANNLNIGWKMKKNSAEAVSNNEIDEILDMAFTNGARAAKLSGAGGGGFILFMTDPENKIGLIRALKERGEIVQFEFTDVGCKSWSIRKD